MDLVDDTGHGHMTEGLHRLFISEGCDPTCHSCDTPILVGDPFALIEGARSVNKDQETKVEVMVCWECRDVDLPEKEQRAVALSKQRDQEIRQGLRTGCFVVNGEIVP